MWLFRPVGVRELELIAASGWQKFPPRLPEQPIFYPVLNQPYAEQIARDWNTKDEASGYAGFVTKFEVPDSYAARFERKVVGGREHEELWVPAEELAEFNTQILDPIRVVASFYGDPLVVGRTVTLPFEGCRCELRFHSSRPGYLYFDIHFGFELAGACLPPVNACALSVSDIRRLVRYLETDLELLAAEDDREGNDEWPPEIPFVAYDCFFELHAAGDGTYRIMVSRRPDLELATGLEGPISEANIQGFVQGLERLLATVEER